MGRCREPPWLGEVEKRGDYTLSLHPLLSPPSNPCHLISSLPLTLTPRLPVALSNLGRKRFQKAQVWARSPRRTSKGLRFRLTYCCAPVVYGGHCGVLESRGSLGSLWKEGEISACPEGEGMKSLVLFLTLNPLQLQGDTHPLLPTPPAICLSLCVFARV